MTSAVNRVIAVENTANSELNYTTQTTDTDSTASSKASESYSDNVSYDVVDIGKAPEDFGDMKDILNKCIESYQGMADYVENLKGKNENLFVRITAKSAEIADISTEDGTGSGMSSAYSLDFQEETPDNDTKTKIGNTQTQNPQDKQAEKLEKKEAQKAANRQETQTKINTKQSEVDNLSTTATQNSDELDQVKLDMETNQDAIDKIMEKVDGKTTATNGLARHAASAGLTGALPAMFSAEGTFAAFTGFSSIFGGGKAKKKAEVQQLGKEAYRAEHKVARLVQQCSNKVQVSECMSEDANNKLKEKQSAIETN